MIRKDIPNYNHGYHQISMIRAFIETSRFSSIPIIAIILDLKRDVTSVQNVTVGLLV